MPSRGTNQRPEKRVQEESAYAIFTQGHFLNVVVILLTITLSINLSIRYKCLPYKHDSVLRA